MKAVLLQHPGLLGLGRKVWVLPAQHPNVDGGKKESLGWSVEDSHA